MTTTTKQSEHSRIENGAHRKKMPSQTLLAPLPNELVRLMMTTTMRTAPRRCRQRRTPAPPRRPLPGGLSRGTTYSNTVWWDRNNGVTSIRRDGRHKVPRQRMSSAAVDVRRLHGMPALPSLSDATERPLPPSHARSLMIGYGWAGDPDRPHKMPLPPDF